MKTKLTVAAAGLLLALGPALAGGGLTINETGATKLAALEQSREVTPELIAKWKATAATSDYSLPMRPL